MIAPPMADPSADHDAPASRFGWARRRIAAGVLIALTLLVSGFVGPGLYASGQVTEEGGFDLGSANDSPARAIIRGEAATSEAGYQVGRNERATVSLPIQLPDPRSDRTWLRVWAYGPKNVTTVATLRRADGSERRLGRSVEWMGKPFDVTEEARRGPVRLRVSSENRTSEPVLFLDKVVPLTAPISLRASGSAWGVGLLFALAAAALLALMARLRRHWPLPLLIGGTAALVWSEIPAKSLEPLGAQAAPLWSTALGASWFGLHDGLLWGSWEGLSSLAVQLFHAATPLVGTAPVSARSASMVVGLLAVTAIYAFGYRAAGRAGAMVAALLAIAAPPFRDAMIAGAPLPALILAGALFGYALHACLARATPLAITLLAGGAVAASLAEPVWLPGALLVIVIVGFVCGARGERWRVVGTGVLATLVLLAPHLASTASQNDGSLFANMSARAIASRNVEFVNGERGSPTASELSDDALSGRPVTLPGYVFGDHSISQVVGGVLAGGQQSFASFSERGGAGGLAVIAFLMVVLGALYVLILPQLRLLVLLTPLVAAPALFIAERGDSEPFAAGAVMWPAMLVSGAILAYATGKLASPVLEPRLLPLIRLRSRLPLPRVPARVSAIRAGLGRLRPGRKAP